MAGWRIVHWPRRLGPRIGEITRDMFQQHQNVVLRLRKEPREKDVEGLDGETQRHGTFRRLGAE